jgi:hypothetical protein
VAGSGDHAIEDLLLSLLFFLLGHPPGGSCLRHVLQLTLRGGRIVELAVDLLLEYFSELDQPAKRL